MRYALWFSWPLLVFVLACLFGYWLGMFWIVVALFVGYGVGQLAAIVRFKRASKSWPGEIREFFHLGVAL